MWLKKLKLGILSYWKYECRITVKLVLHVALVKKRESIVFLTGITPPTSGLCPPCLCGESVSSDSPVESNSLRSDNEEGKFSSSLVLHRS